MRVRLRQLRWEAEGVVSAVLEPLPGAALPPFTAGAHLDLALAPGLTRSYSLCNAPGERDRYEIAVQLAPESRGGSRWVHERWRVGDVLAVSEPRNHFALEEAAPLSVLIAGGIGITPMLAMIARLNALGRGWALHYAVRTRARAAFLDRLADPRVRVVYDHEGDAPLDLAAIVAAAPRDAHLYCCGPTGMLKAFEAAAAGRHAHVEYFAAAAPAATAGGYALELRRSGRTVAVAPGQRMLDALLAAGVMLAYSCAQGLCGACETRVLGGVPDHRDDYLTEEEKAANRTVMPCCSGAKSPVLVLDL